MGAQHFGDARGKKALPGPDLVRGLAFRGLDTFLHP